MIKGFLDLRNLNKIHLQTEGALTRRESSPLHSLRCEKQITEHKLCVHEVVQVTTCQTPRDVKEVLRKTNVN